MSFKRYITSIATLATVCITLNTAQVESAYFCDCWGGDLFGWGYLDITNGYREDKMTCEIDEFVPDDVLGDVLIGTNSLEVSDIQLYQIGVKGKWTFCNVLLYVEGDYGCGNTGNYNETGTSLGEEDTIIKGLIHDCQMGDFTIGTGYLFWPHCCVGLGPTAGWSYHHQRIKTKDVTTNGFETPFLDDVKYRQCWQGPWVGADVVFLWCQLSVNASYEYHWNHWHASWDLDGHNIPGVAFSDHRRSTDGHGNVFYIDAMWNFCFYWNVGVGFKYQDFKATNGSENPDGRTFAQVGFPANEFDEVPEATWRSWAVTFDLGYTF